MPLIKTNLDSLDFANLYTKQMELSTFKGKSSQEWDKRANSMNINVHKSIYTKTFVDNVDTKDCNSLLDIGCGPGTFSLAMASKL